MNDIAVAALTPMTTIDFPGRLAAVVFCQGCPWNCGYCHNPDLRPRRGCNGLRWSQVLELLRRRGGLLDGVVFSGGEPTLQSGLIDAVRNIKDLGFEVGLHTAGPYPAKLERLLPWLDWIGIDVKAPFDRYETVSGVPGSGARAKESLMRVLHSGVEYEVRTTFDTRLIAEDELLSMARELATLGVSNYVFQECRSGVNPMVHDAIPEGVMGEMEELFEDFSVRRH
jgi:pyruvate formate lyase activating enzyme